MGLQDRPILEDQRRLFLDHYLASTGDENIHTRLRAHEPIAVALQLTSWYEQLRRLDHAVRKDSGRTKRAEEIRNSLSHAVAVIERDGSDWF